MTVVASTTTSVRPCPCISVKGVREYLNRCRTLVSDNFKLIISLVVAESMIWRSKWLFIILSTQRLYMSHNIWMKRFLPSCQVFSTTFLVVSRIIFMSTREAVKARPVRLWIAGRRKLCRWSGDPLFWVERIVHVLRHEIGGGSDPSFRNCFTQSSIASARSLRSSLV